MSVMQDKVADLCVPYIQDRVRIIGRERMMMKRKGSASKSGGETRGHVVRLLQRVKGTDAREWYARAAIRQGWSRSVLEVRIKQQAHQRAGRAQNNFRLTLPPSTSDLAGQVFKDPYLFDFLGTADPRREREVEQALVDHIQRFLLELGTGFAFVRRHGAWQDCRHGSLVARTCWWR